MRILLILLTLVCTKAFADNFCDGRQQTISKALEDTLLKKCSDMTFEDLQIINTFNLSNLQITEISADDLKNLNSLNEIDLSFNMLKTLPLDLFKYNPKLEYLILKNNQIVELPIDFFRVNSSVGVVDLKHNRIKQVPQELFSNTQNLYEVSLSYNQIEFLPEKLFYNSYVDTFYCKACGLKTLPEDLFSKSMEGALDSVYLSQNKLSSLPKIEINLEDLYLSGNRFTEIPDFDTEIVYLELSKNPIEIISEKSFQKTISVDYLYLNSMDIKKIDVSSFSNLNSTGDNDEKILISFENSNVDESTKIQLKQLYQDKIIFVF